MSQSQQGKKIELKQRFRIIFWHASTCDDRTIGGKFKWRSKLAKGLNLAHATITHWSQKLPNAKGKGRGADTSEALATKEDEIFLRLIGFDLEEPPRDSSSIRDWNALIQAVANCQDEEAYADVCMLVGLPLIATAKKGVEERSAQKAERERSKQARWRTRDKACWHQSLGAIENIKNKLEVPMHPSETECIRRLYDLLTEHDKLTSATILKAQSHSGVSYALQRLLPHQDGFTHFYSGGIYHLHMDALDRTSDKNVRKALVKDILGRSILGIDDAEGVVEIVGPQAKKLAAHLHRNKSLLILHGASAIRSENIRFIDELANQLIELASLTGNQPISRLLLTCWDGDSFMRLHNRSPRAFSYLPSITSDKAFGYFETALEHYHDVRSSVSVSGKPPHVWPDSTMMKRVAYHYAAQSRSHNEFPSAVRFRAFCASDTESASPFDPTQGLWGRLNESLRNKIPEISDCLGDIQTDIRVFSPEGRPNDLDLLNLISTGVFFLTDSMLKRLKDHALSKSFVANDLILEENFRTDSYFRVIEGLDGQGSRAAMPLLVRSLLQDDWARFRPESRCAIHEAIADILHKMAQIATPTDMATELPYAPTWGSGKLALALEAIRHFVRAAQSATPENAERLTRLALTVYDTLLEPGVLVTNSVSGVGSEVSDRPGQLSRKFGLYGLKYEVLCLLSPDGLGHAPPSVIGAKYRIAFFAEMGITLIKLLRPQKAIFAFASGLNEAGLSAVDKSYLLAHSITAYIMVGDSETARIKLSEAREIESEIDVSNEMREVIRNRNDAREAALLMAENVPTASIAAWGRLASMGLVAFWSDRAIGFLDAHLALPDTKAIDIAAAWKVAEQASNMAHAEKLEHDRLRIEIRRAAIARILGYPFVSEAILDQVGLDLARHGGGEIAFREFQFESARTLLTTNRPRYAFLAYGLPAFEALSGSDAGPWICRAAELCKRLLDAIDLHPNEMLPNLKEEPYWLESEEIEHPLAHPFFSVDLLPPHGEVESLFRALGDSKMRQTYLLRLSEYLDGCGEETEPPSIVSAS